MIDLERPFGQQYTNCNRLQTMEEIWAKLEIAFAKVQLLQLLQ
jgi:hypothetical protein